MTKFPIIFLPTPTPGTPGTVVNQTVNTSQDQNQAQDQAQAQGLLSSTPNVVVIPPALQTQAQGAFASLGTKLSNLPSSIAAEVAAELASLRNLLSL